MSALELRNERMSVALDDARPIVLGYGTVFDDARLLGAGDDGAIAVNGQIVPWSAWEISMSADVSAGQAGYDLSHATASWRLRFGFVLEGTELLVKIEVLDDPEGTLRTLGFPGMWLVTCPEAGFSFWREKWVQAAWNTFEPGWPEPVCGNTVCRGFENRRLHDALPDAAALPTVHACVFNGNVCGAVKTNYPHLPVLTRSLLSDRHPERAGTFGIGLNTYQYRVRQSTMPPLQARVVLLGDTNGDGIADESDYHLWLNRQFPGPNPLYRERVWYKVLNARRLGDVSATYPQTLEIIEAIHNVTDHMPQMAYLVGWQYEGHDTGFPSHDRLNPLLGTRGDLLELVETARDRFDCLISYHANVDDAYRLYPGWDDDLMCRDVDGSLMPWMVFDERQSYHLCHTKDVESGQIFRRMDAMLKLIPVEKTIHLDAFRYSNHSWEPDGFIGSMEELVCGVRPILDYFAERGIDVSLESVDGWPMDCAGWFSAVFHLEDYWKAQITHGKILGGGRYPALGGWGMGSGINRDLDYAMLQNDWATILDFIYEGALLYRFYLEREMVLLRLAPHRMHMRFDDGVEVELEERKEHLRVTWGDVLVASGYDRFIPLRGSIYAYSRDGGDRTWRLPEGWRGSSVEAFALSRSGRQPAPNHRLTDEDIRIVMPPRTPIKLVKVG